MLRKYMNFLRMQCSVINLYEPPLADDTMQETVFDNVGIIEHRYRTVMLLRQCRIQVSSSMNVG